MQGNSNLAWSYSVLNLVLQRTLHQPMLQHMDVGLSHAARSALGDALHVMQQSAAIFKLMLRMLKTPTESQLLSFLRKLKKLLNAVSVGEAVLLPLYVENIELILLLHRASERQFRAVLVQTDPHSGLRFHSASPVEAIPAICYRTCMVFNDIPKKNVLDDVFWLAMYNMSVHPHENDMDRLYDVLLPFLTGKPLEVSLVEAERAAARFEDAATAPVNGGDDNVYDADTRACREEKSSRSMSPQPQPTRDVDSESVFKYCGGWRAPQRSNTAYVRCILEALHYMLRSKLEVTEMDTRKVKLSDILLINYLNLILYFVYIFMLTQ
jgi:hypothetical protein